MTQHTNPRLLKIIKRILVYLFVILAVLLSIAPIVYLVITSFKEPELTFAIPPVWNFTPTLLNYEEVLAFDLLWQIFRQQHLHRPGYHGDRHAARHPGSLWIFALPLSRAFLAENECAHSPDAAPDCNRCPALRACSVAWTGSIPGRH